VTNLPLAMFLSKLSNLEEEAGSVFYTSPGNLPRGDLFPARFASTPHENLNKRAISMPGCGILSVSGLDKEGLQTIDSYLSEFPEELKFGQAAEDYRQSWSQQTRPGLLSMFAGQLCYQSFREDARTTTDELSAYLQHVISSKPPHGALFEHVYVSMLVYGLPRSISHEIVRHRAGWGFSQVSTRYIPPRNLRFCVRREIEQNPHAWEVWCNDASTAADRYTTLMATLDESISVDLPKTDKLKQLRQASRDILPHYVETAMVLTGNMRAWRNLLDHRANPLADTSFSELAFRCFLLLLSKAPHFLADYQPVLTKDVFGIWRAGVKTDNPKV